jgi:hypothetical protein
MNHSIISNTLFFSYNFANLSIKRPPSSTNSLSTIIQLDNNPFTYRLSSLPTLKRCWFFKVFMKPISIQKYIGEISHMRCQRTCKITILSWRFCEVRWINVGFENIYHIETSPVHMSLHGVFLALTNIYKWMVIAH